MSSRAWLFLAEHLNACTDIFVYTTISSQQWNIILQVLLVSLVRTCRQQNSKEVSSFHIKAICIKIAMFHIVWVLNFARCWHGIERPSPRLQVCTRIDHSLVQELHPELDFTIFRRISGLDQDIFTIQKTLFNQGCRSDIIPLKQSGKKLYQLKSFGLQTLKRNRIFLFWTDIVLEHIMYVCMYGFLWRL